MDYLRTGVWHPSTRTHIRLLGPCFKTGRIRTHKNAKTSVHAPELATQAAHSELHAHLSEFQRRRPASKHTDSLASNDFTCYLTLSPKCFSSFPHGTCSLSVSRQYLALDGYHHPLHAPFPRNATRRLSKLWRRLDSHTGLSPSGTWISIELAVPGAVHPTRLQFRRLKAQDCRLSCCRFTRRY